MYILQNKYVVVKSTQTSRCNCIIKIKKNDSNYKRQQQRHHTYKLLYLRVYYYNLCSLKCWFNNIEIFSSYTFCNITRRLVPEAIYWKLGQ